MGIQSGQTLLHYRLIDKIGEGGMGVVWRALDTTLDREVAVKFLSQAFAADAERLARFEREAKLLASLNHPGIAAVYGLHQADTSEGATHFIVMELVGGEDLAERLARGPLTVARALGIAAQIAEGLSAAHETGVIHRDLKPANIKLTEEGKVKILDFGLAKAAAPQASSGGSDPSNSPTMTSAGTVVGMILGTAAYMSPEQARGRATDRRTDIWALGAVLFEMLTGRAPFGGESVTDIIARIIEREPDWDSLPSPMHPGVRRLLERCLNKDAGRRMRDAADVRLEIDELLEDPTGQRLAPAAVGANPDAGPPPAPKAGAIMRAVPWLLAAALLAWAVAATLQPVVPPDPVVHFEINPPAGFQFAEFTTSPDGSAVAFVAVSRDAARSLWIRRLDSTAPRRLGGTDGAWFPFWSPDSRKIGFFARGKLRSIDVASETPQTIADAPNGRGGSWAFDDTILFAPEGAAVLYSVPATGGTAEPRTTFQPPESSHRFPHFIAGTRRFTYSAHDTGNSRTLRRYLASLDSDELIRLPDGMSETYAPAGHALYVREQTLFAHELAAGGKGVTGEPVPLAQDIDDTFPRTARSSFSVSDNDNGVLMYLARRRVDSRIDAYDRRGRKLDTVVRGGRYERMKLSGDGKQLLYTQPGAVESSVWRLDVARGSASRLVVLPVPSIDIDWFPDGRSFVYAPDGELLRMSIDDGESRPILTPDTPEKRAALNSNHEPDVAPSGEFLAFTAWDPVTDFDLWVVPLAAGSAPRRLSNAEGVQSRPAVSPDSRFIAYGSNESGRFEVYVRPVGDLSAAQGHRGDLLLVSTGGGSAPVWSTDGTELYYVSADYGIMAVAIRRGSGDRLEASLPVRLFDGPLSVENDADIFFRQPTLLGVDDDRFFFQVPDAEVRDRTIEVILNWQRLLTP